MDTRHALGQPCLLEYIIFIIRGGLGQQVATSCEDLQLITFALGRFAKRKGGVASFSRGLFQHVGIALGIQGAVATEARWTDMCSSTGADTLWLLVYRPGRTVMHEAWG